MIKLKSLLFEILSPTEASEIFRRFGVANASSISKDDLKSKYKELVLQHHPDKGGGTYEMQMINAAYDVLKDYENSKPNYYTGGEFTNERDVNYIKRKGWEISGRPPQTREYAYSIWNWDGHYFRGMFTVYAIPEKLFEISKMMIKWDDFFKSVAVFYTKPNIPNTVFLVNLRGQEVSPPKKFEHESMNQNPSNDSHFVDMLRKTL